MSTGPRIWLGVCISLSVDAILSLAVFHFLLFKTDTRSRFLTAGLQQFNAILGPSSCQILPMTNTLVSCMRSRR